MLALTPSCLHSYDFVNVLFIDLGKKIGKRIGVLIAKATNVVKVYAIINKTN